MGLFDWPFESPRSAIARPKARRNISLELRFDLELDERRRPRLRTRFSSKEIKVALDRDAASERDVKRLETRIGRLHASTVLTVLNPRVMHLQLPLGRYDIVGAETFVLQISEDAKFTIVVRVVNQGRLWKHAFQTQVVGEKPDDTTAGTNYRSLVEREAHSDHGKNFVFLSGNVANAFAGILKSVAWTFFWKKRAGFILIPAPAISFTAYLRARRAFTVWKLSGKP